MKPRTVVIAALLLAATSCVPAPTSPGDSVTRSPDPAVTSPPLDGTPRSQAPANPSYAPQHGDVNLERSTLFIGESTIILRESFPVQVAVLMAGELPTPCHQLRAVVHPPNEENKILVEAYTVVNPDVICIQVLKPFQEMIELGTFSSGRYTVWVNGILVGEIDV